MTDKTRCKCCGNDAEWTYYSNDYGMEEEYIRCQCGYYYEFAYGNYIEKKPGEPAMMWDYLRPERIPVPEEFWQKVCL